MTATARALVASFGAPEGSDWAVVGLALPGICEAAVSAGAVSVKGMDPDEDLVRALELASPWRSIELDVCHPEALCVRSSSIDVALAVWGRWEEATVEGVLAELLCVTKPGGLVMLAKPPAGLLGATDEGPDGGLLNGWEIVRDTR